jgi:hypothetical protein
MARSLATSIGNLRAFAVFRFSERVMSPHDIIIRANECAAAALSTKDADRQMILLHMMNAWLTLAAHHASLGAYWYREYNRLADLQSKIIPTLH